MREYKNIFDLTYVTTYEIDSIIPTWVEEETSTTTQGEVGQSFEIQDDIPNPNIETPAKNDEMKGQQ
jgi:hypothetical protein